MTNYIVYAIPVFMLLIALELIIDRWKKRGYYRFSDSITNLNLGMGQQLTGIFLKFFSVLLYKYVYDHFRLFDIPMNVLTYGLLFFGVDFFYYWFHRLSHEISVMWGGHVVHHQSEDYNFSVALRQSWTQGLFSWMFYIPLAFIGFETTAFVTIASFQTLYQFWIHTQAINRLPRFFEYFLNTPSHHRVHHGQNPKYIDKNHGGTFIIFDRWFGTFQEEDEPVVYGVTKAANSWNPVWLNFDYWFWLWDEIKQAKNMKDKLLMLIKQPGWRPENIGGPHASVEQSVETFKKFDILLPKSLYYYVLTQFLLLLTTTAIFLTFSENTFFSSNLLYTLLYVVLLVLFMFSISALMEKKTWAIPLEIIKNVLFVTVNAFLFFQLNLPNALYFSLALAVLFGALSIWLLQMSRSLNSEKAHF